MFLVELVEVRPVLPVWGMCMIVLIALLIPKQLVPLCDSILVSKQIRPGDYRKNLFKTAIRSWNTGHQLGI